MRISSDIKRGIDFVLERGKSLQSTKYPFQHEKMNLEALYKGDNVSPLKRPKSCTYEVGSNQTLRGALAHTLNEVNKVTGGAVMAAAADLYGSTSTSNVGAGFGEGFWHGKNNTSSRLFSAGGITEDAIGGICSGMATMGYHLTMGSSYGAFMAPLTFISARTHSIGQQTIRHRTPGESYKTFISLCGHTGIKTGEDGPTHAEPNTLSMFQDNYPGDVLITLTPWDPNDLWPLTIAALKARPAVLVPYVTRPNEKIYDRQALGLAMPEESVDGVYRLLKANGKADGSIVYQGSDVANFFVEGVLPWIKKKGLNLDVYYVASTELFNRLDESKRKSIYSEDVANSAMMITGFTKPTIYRWITSEKGRQASLYAHQSGKYLGSGAGEICLEEAGLHPEAQIKAIESYLSNK